MQLLIIAEVDPKLYINVFTSPRVAGDLVGVSHCQPFQVLLKNIPWKQMYISNHAIEVYQVSQSKSTAPTEATLSEPETNLIMDEL